MQVVFGINNYQAKKSSAIAIGSFDGLHIGHKIIFQTLKSFSEFEKVVITFSNHPRMLTCKNQKLSLIYTLEEKIEIFHLLGIDVLIIEEFTQELMNKTAKEFLGLLKEKLLLKKLVVGFNNHFGSDRISLGNNLNDLAKELDFQVVDCLEKKVNNNQISSTFIRGKILDGQFENLKDYLLRDFFITGKVVHGFSNGSKIGFPTVNLLIEQENKILPKNGVYAGYVFICDKKYNCVINIGVRPTVVNLFSIEAHIINYTGNLYNKTLRIYFTNFIREEKKFDNINLLKEQIAKDISFFGS